MRTCRCWCIGGNQVRQSVGRQSTDLARVSGCREWEFRAQRGGLHESHAQVLANQQRNVRLIRLRRGLAGQQRPGLIRRIMKAATHLEDCQRLASGRGQ